MEDQASLRQTVTHLFDAVKHGKQAQELEEAARHIEGNLEMELSKLESRTEELNNILSTMKEDSQDALKSLSRQLTEFLAVAKEQSRSRLVKEAKEELENNLAAAAGERDKALKSLEAYFASNPLPATDSAVTVRLVEGTYIAQAKYDCEGGVGYEFGLAVQNSRLFTQEFSPSRLGRELRVPVRFSRTFLKGRVPGFERLDQYTLSDAELSNGKFRASFQRQGDGAKIKVVTSGFGADDFMGLEYSDQSGAVNIMNDLSLVAHLDMPSLKSAMADIADEINEITDKKVTLLKLTIEDEDLLETLNCYKVLERVMSVLGPNYKSLLEHMPESQPIGAGSEELSVVFVRERLRVLGDLAKPISQLLGIKDLGRLYKPPGT